MARRRPSPDGPRPWPALQPMPSSMRRPTLSDPTGRRRASCALAYSASSSRRTWPRRGGNSRRGDGRWSEFSHTSRRTAANAGFRVRVRGHVRERERECERMHLREDISRGEWDRGDSDALLLSE